MSDFFSYKNNELHCEELSVQKLANQLGTPLYIYSYGALREQFVSFDSAFKGTDHLICYSMKANSNKAILRSFVKEGGGIDVVSGGELKRALLAGCDPQKIVFSGVGKTEEEIREALKANILQFNVESIEELGVINRVADGDGKKAPIALRVNPDVDSKTHAYISTGLKKSKFGISHTRAREIYRQAAKMEAIRVVGIHCHIGSQLTSVEPIREALKKIRALMGQLKEDGITISQFDIGGGLGITYHDEAPPTPKDYANVVTEELQGLKLKLILEPGRFLVGNTGILVTRVIYNKERDSKKFIITDAASNDLMRPALYDAYHEIEPVIRHTDREQVVVDIVGPVCETGDFFAHDRKIERIASGELLAIRSVGAYGHAMASNYNSRPKAAEVLVYGNEYFVTNKREKLEDIIKGERVPLFLE